ncbi:hypothetical protein MBLNU230_g3833t1 [Neophaeotheca triangularis]
MDTATTTALPWTPHRYPTQRGPWSEKINLSEGAGLETMQSPDKPIPAVIHAVNNSTQFSRPGRSLVICLDGTGDKFDMDNSNIVKLVSCLKKDDPSQVTYYQTGIGTYDGSGLKTGFSAAIDMAVGSGLGTHIRDAYQFLMQNYKQGDRICLFGFSRGSYTARCLAGMLHKVGLLPAHNVAQIPFAYEFYKDSSEHGWDMSRKFKKTFCIDVSVYFVGVWDCVASVGFIPRKLPFGSTRHNKIRHFRHAMALDEHRAKFKVCHWVKPSYLAEKSKGGEAGVMKPTKPDEEERVEETDIKEVWFAGAHADCGGGAVHNDERHMLSRIPLRWMLRQCFECDTGILFQTARLAEFGLDVPTLFPNYQRLPKPNVGPSPAMLESKDLGTLPPLSTRSESFNIVPVGQHGEFAPQAHNKRSPQRPNPVPEQVEDFFDAQAPINDQLVLAKAWWILEFWPVKVPFQHAETEEWQKNLRMNLGLHRAVRDVEPMMHWTVQKGVEEKRYQVQARVGKNAFWRSTT